MTAAMFFVEGKPEFFLLGAALIAGSTVFYEIANVNYNAMLLQVSTPRNMGRVSGFGWGMGYLGGIVVLLIALVGFIFGDGPYWFGITADNGMNIRVIAVFAAVSSAARGPESTEQQWWSSRRPCSRGTGIRCQRQPR